MTYRESGISMRPHLRKTQHATLDIRKYYDSNSLHLFHAFHATHRSQTNHNNRSKLPTHYVVYMQRIWRPPSDVSVLSPPRTRFLVCRWWPKQRNGFASTTTTRSRDSYDRGRTGKATMSEFLTVELHVTILSEGVTLEVGSPHVPGRISIGPAEPKLSRAAGRWFVFFPPQRGIATTVYMPSMNWNWDDMPSSFLLFL